MAPDDSTSTTPDPRRGPGAVPRPRLTSTGSRRGPAARALSSPPRAVPSIPAPLPEAPPPVRAPDGNRSGTRRVLIALCALLVCVGGGVALLWSTHSEPAPTLAEAARTTSPYPGPPIPLAVDSEYVDTDVLDAGDLVVSHWIRTSLPVDRLTLGVPLGSGLTDETLQVRDLVVAADGVPVATTQSDVPDASWEAVVPGAHEVYVQYRLVGAAPRSGSVGGRALATVTSLDVGVGSDRPLAKTVVFSGSKVLALACLAPGARATPSPCGKLVDQAWTLDFAAGDAPATVIAQLDLDASRVAR